MPKVIDGKKVCTKCSLSLPFTNKFFYKRGSGYLKAWCIDCDKVIRQKYKKPWVPRNWDEPTRAKRRATERKRKQRRRIQVLSHYCGGNPPFCACCKDPNVEFLCLDHTDGGGNIHRQSISKSGKKCLGSFMFEWIVINDFPDGFRVLCHNCNSSISLYGYCPHNEARPVEELISCPPVRGNK